MACTIVNQTADVELGCRMYSSKFESSELSRSTIGRFPPKDLSAAKQLPVMAISAIIHKCQLWGQIFNLFVLVVLTI